MNIQRLKKMIRTDRKFTPLYTDECEQITSMKNDDLARLIDHLDLANTKARCALKELNPADAFALEVLETHFDFHVRVIEGN